MLLCFIAEIFTIVFKLNMRFTTLKNVVFYVRYCCNYLLLNNKSTFFTFIKVLLKNDFFNDKYQLLRNYYLKLINLDFW
jgi:hypothetical protein